MHRAARIRLVIAAAVVITAALVWLSATLQRNVAQTRGERLEAVDQLLLATLREEFQLHSDAEHGLDARVRDALEARSDYRDVRAESEGVGEVEEAIDAFIALHDRWELLADRSVGGDVPGYVVDQPATLVAALERATDELRSAVASEQDEDQAGLTFVLIGLSAGLFLIVGGTVSVLAGRRERDRRAVDEGRKAYVATQGEFAETLQLLGDEQEAHQLVSGEVIGAVLVTHEEPLGEVDHGIRLARLAGDRQPAQPRPRGDACGDRRADRPSQPPRAAGHRRRRVAQAGRSLEPLAVLALDLDSFKKINDQFGHEKGDDVLAAAGPLLADGMRESDFAARAGGEEFSILLPGTGEEGAREVAEKLRKAIARLEVPGVERQITGSFGIAVYPTQAIDAPTLLRKAAERSTSPRRTGAIASSSRPRPRSQPSSSGGHARLATESAFQALIVTIRPSRAATSDGLNSAATSS